MHPDGLSELALVKLSGFESIDDRVILSLANLCQDLNGLTLSSMNLLGQEAQVKFSQLAIQILQKGPPLHLLHLSALCWGCPDQADLVLEAISSAKELCLQTMSLSLNPSWW